MTRRARGRPWPRTPSASGSASRKGAPPAGSGPATCPTGTWTSTPTTGAEAVKLWGGNYSAGPDAAFWEFNRSFPFDRRLLAEEVAASRAYVRALARAGAIPEADAAR